MRFIGAVYERVLLESRFVTELLSAQVTNPLLHSGVSVLHMMLHGVLLSEALRAPRTFMRLLILVDEH